MLTEQKELGSCWLKIERAKEHFTTIGSEIVTWVKTEPLRIIKEAADDKGEGYRVFVEVINQPPIERWALIAGDCIHNLRSALDSLLYGIAIHETGVNPPLDAKVLQFPIVSERDKFPAQKYRITSLSPAVQIEVENMQPFNRPHPELPPLLELLSNLNNQDKHRLLNVVAASPYSASINATSKSPEFRISSITAFRTLILGKTEIVSFTVDPPTPNLEYTCEAVVPICIVHAPGPSKSGLDDLPAVLNMLIEEVEKIAFALVQSAQ